jgi:hypothetical protein
MKLAALSAIVLVAGTAQITHAAELLPAAVTAWNAYVEQAGSRAQERTSGRLPFFWMDESPDRAARVGRGEVVIAPAVGHGSQAVPRGLIHDWIGAIFIPGARLDWVWAVVRDYNNYPQMYRPAVASSKELAGTGEGREFQMVWQHKALFVCAVMQGRFEVHDVRLDARRSVSVAEALEMRDIERYGHAGQRLLPPGTGNGFIWRIRSIARYEERDGGVYMELEVMALTRDIPPSLAWLVNPVVNRLSINSLTTTLRQTRDAVLSRQGPAESSPASSFPVRASLARKTGRQ